VPGVGYQSFDFGSAVQSQSAFLTTAAKLEMLCVEILNFAPLLEYLEMNFYDLAVRSGATGTGTIEQFVTTARAHQTAHVATPKKALGANAIKQPKFDFGIATQSAHGVAKYAIELEDLGVRAYQGQAPNITETAVLKVALSIHSVEAHHSAWIRYIVGKDPTYTGAFEKPLTKAQVLKAVNATGFVQQVSLQAHDAGAARTAGRPAQVHEQRRRPRQCRVIDVRMGGDEHERVGVVELVQRDRAQPVGA
jgi:hypothetical protein